MIKILTQIQDLRFGDLMALYDRDLQEAAKRDYPKLPSALGLMEAQQDFYAYLRDVFFPAPGAIFALLEEGNSYLSALRLEPYEDGLLLCGLITDPAHHRQGYAKALIEETLRHLPAGSRVYSHVAKENVASALLHRSCGFQPVEGPAKMLNGELLHNFMGFLKVV